MKKTTININGRPFTFDDELLDISYDTVRPITEKEAKDILEKTKLEFDKINLPFVLAYGTLLGAVRENGLIKGDDDVDIFINDEKKLRDNLPVLQKNNLKLCRFIEHKLYSFRIEHDYFIDVYIHEKINSKFWCIYLDRLNNFSVPRHLISKFEEIDFLGGKYLVPKRPERLLRFWYGKTWNVPIANAHTNEEDRFYVWWQTKGRHKINRIKQIMMRIKLWKKY